MSRIFDLPAVTNENLPAVTVYPLEGEAVVGKPQDVLVDVEPDGVIPLHTHTVDATMLIVGGEGKVLSSDPELNGKEVAKGKVVFFEREVPHGFKAGPRGLLFISKNGGIVSSSGEAWDIAFAS